MGIPLQLVRRLTGNINHINRRTNIAQTGKKPKIYFRRTSYFLNELESEARPCRGKKSGHVFVLIRFYVVASYHFHMTRGVKKSASYKQGASKTCTPARKHASYIFREGQYHNMRDKDADDLVDKDSGNLPYWAVNGYQFWRQSDLYERANGTTYREYEFALPREFSEKQQIELVRAFVAQEMGTRHTFQWAIHCPKASIEGGPQPHCHLMFSERINDGIDRDPDQYFMRFNAAKPELGGCRKTNSAKTKAEAGEELIALRKRWADLQNMHLEKHGHADRVDHRTLRAQGIDREPEEHLGPVGGNDPDVIEAMLAMRGAKKDVEVSAKALGVVLEVLNRKGEENDKDDSHSSGFDSRFIRSTAGYDSPYTSPYSTAFGDRDGGNGYRSPDFSIAMSNLPSSELEKNQRDSEEQATPEFDLSLSGGQVHRLGRTRREKNRGVELSGLRANHIRTAEQPELDFNSTDLVEPIVNVFELITEADEKEDSADIVNLNVDVQKELIKDTGVDDSELKSKQMRVEELTNDLKVGWVFEFEIFNKKFQQEAQRLAELHVFNNLNIEAMVHASHGDETYLTENDKTILDRENLWWLIDAADIDQEEELELDLVPEFEPEPETAPEEEPKPEQQLDIYSGSDRIAYYLARSVTLTEERNAREIRLKANLKKLEDNLNNRQPSSIFIDDISYTTDPINIELVDVLKQLKDANTFDKAHPLQITDFLGSPILDHLRAISKLLKTVCIDVKNKFIELIDGITSLTFTTDQNRGKDLDRTKPSVSAPSLSLELDLRPSPYDNRKK